MNNYKAADSCNMSDPAVLRFCIVQKNCEIVCGRWWLNNNSGGVILVCVIFCY